MRFMIFMKANQDTEAGVMPTQAELEAMGAYNQELAEAGILRAGEGLHPSSRGVRVSFADAETVVTDGPFAETKELVAGYWIFEVDSMEEAVSWVKRCPAGERPFEIEIRQIFEADDFGEAFTPELRQAQERMRREIATPSEPEYRELVERINQAWIDNDRDVLLDHITDDIRWAMVGHSTAEGRQEFVDTLDSMPSMTTQEFHPGEVLIDGSKATVTGTMKTRDEEGQDQSFGFCDIYDFRGTLIREITSYVLTLDAPT
jgi:ketosteroid isomerase-like protein